MAFTSNPEYWRHRAEEVRIISEELKNQQTKLLMERIAKTYEEIADCVQHAWCQDKYRNGHTPSRHELTR